MRRRRVNAFLHRVRRAVAEGRVHVPTYAADRAAGDLGWDREDILDVLVNLGPDDFFRAEPSLARPEDLLWVLCPVVVDMPLWSELVERGSVIVVSFHER